MTIEEAQAYAEKCKSRGWQIPKSVQAVLNGTATPRDEQVAAIVAGSPAKPSRQPHTGGLGRALARERRRAGASHSRRRH